MCMCSPEWAYILSGFNTHHTLIEMLQVALSPVNVAIAIPLILVALSSIQQLRLWYRIRALPGVRAPSLARSYITGGSARARLQVCH